MRWIAALATVCSLAVGQSEAPSFEGYPANEPFTGTPVAPRLDTRSARMFRTELRRQAATGPNFAGHYTLAMWGCGSGCSTFAVIDAETGRVTFPPFASEDARADDRTYCQRGVSYELSSTLLVVAGKVNGTVGTHYFNWARGKFTKVYLDTTPTDNCSP